MIFKKIFSQFNIINQCRKYKLSLWQCPHFLFLIMGIMIIISILVSYAVSSRYISDPLLVALIVIFLTIVLFIIAVIITNSFEKMAEANRLKSEFISIASHQLRSPLSNLNWTIEFLISGRSGQLGEKQIEYLKILKENSLRMEELISDLLTISRIEAAMLSLNKKEISLEELIKEQIFKTKAIAESAGVKIEFRAQANLPKIFADPFQIKQVIENFLDNAIRYSRKNGKVEIKLEKRDKNLYFEIKDQGIGIPKEDQKHIFQKFFRSSNVSKHQTQGSGLGLYIVKSIIEKSGGKIGFQSKENQGSTFWFTLPLRAK